MCVCICVIFKSHVAALRKPIAISPKFTSKGECCYRQLLFINEFCELIRNCDPVVDCYKNNSVFSMNFAQNFNFISRIYGMLDLSVL